MSPRILESAMDYGKTFCYFLCCLAGVAPPQRPMPREIRMTKRAIHEDRKEAVEFGPGAQKIKYKTRCHRRHSQEGVSAAIV